MHWIKSSLNNKFVLGTASGLLISSMVFLLLFISMYHGELEKQRTETVSQINRLLRTSLENAMLKRDLDGLRDIVHGLGQQSGINAVMIVNPKGEVRFSNHSYLIGNQLPDLTGAVSSSTKFIEMDNGNEILRSTHPVHNREACIECHGPLSLNPVNGILLVDYDAAPIRAQALKTTLILMGSGGIIVLINIIGGWWFIRRFVLRPVDRLAFASLRLANGDLSARVAMEGDDELAKLGRTFDDMAEKLQEKLLQLEEKESFLQALVDAIPDGIRVIDSDYRLQLTNEAYTQQLGVPHDNLRGIKCFRSSHGLSEPCAPTLFTCPIREINENQNSSLKMVHRHIRSDGTPLNVEIYAAPMHVSQNGKPKTMIVESIRDLEKEVRFSQEQRLSELGMLAAGVAHEIHNPLASVRLALHATRQSLNESDPDRDSTTELMDIVDREIDICIDVTERLLKLSTPPPVESELVNVASCITDTLSLMRWEAETSGVQIETTIPEISPRILATANDIGMITLNFAQNALHAMPDGGTLHVSVSSNDGWVSITFEDTGIGIDEKALKEIFYPFYSRRANDSHGSGLGLPISKAIIENHGGILNVESIPGEGSKFEARLPDADFSQTGTA